IRRPAPTAPRSATGSACSTICGARGGPGAGRAHRALGTGVLHTHRPEQPAAVVSIVAYAGSRKTGVLLDHEIHDLSPLKAEGPAVEPKGDGSTRRSCSCERRESNPDGFPHRILSSVERGTADKSRPRRCCGCGPCASVCCPP